AAAGLELRADAHRYGQIRCAEEDRVDALDFENVIEVPDCFGTFDLYGYEASRIFPLSIVAKPGSDAVVGGAHMGEATLAERRILHGLDDGAGIGSVAHEWRQD